MDKAIRRRHKTMVWDFINELDKASIDQIESTFCKYCSEIAVWEIFHPFNAMHGCKEAGEGFWVTLANAIPDMERRLDIFAGDVYKGDYWVTCMGSICGNFENSWLGIPPTGGVLYLRIGEFYKVQDNKIVKAHILLDIPDVMRQAGVYPFRPMTATAGFVPGPKKHNGIRLGEDDPERKTLETILRMHKALHDFDGKDINSMKHSHYWSEHFLYYAPAGIGTTRGMENFKRYHQQPFLASFPDRHGTEHYCRISDGPIACTTHWGTLTATHLGSEWMDLPATGKKLKMRVADWYCVDENGRLNENWLFMDILDIHMQMGIDVLGIMAHRLGE